MLRSTVIPGELVLTGPEQQAARPGRLRSLARRCPLRVVRVDWPFPALELVPPSGRGWFLCRLPR